MTARWRNRLTPDSVPPITERLTSNYPETRHFWIFQNLGVRLRYFHGLQKRKKHIKRVRGAVSLSLHCLSSRPAEYPERVPLDLFQWEKEGSRWTSSFQAFLDDFQNHPSLNSVLLHGDH